MDNRLQNLESVDIHGFQFPNTAGFDSAYSTDVYSHGLNNAQPVHPHAQPHFVPDGQVYFDPNIQQQQQPRQQRRGVTQKPSLPGQQQNANVNLNANIDPNLNGSSGPKNAAQTQPRRTRRDPQQAQPVQFIDHLSPSNQQLLQSPPIQQSPTSARRPPSSAVTPVQSVRHEHQQSAHSTHVRTPTSATVTATTPNPNSSIADQLTAFNPPSTFDFVPNPPNLDEWRERFFNIADPILLTSEEYHTYFPHVDNIYSHRSTQKYKKKPFVSHYWDCRLKGRPTGQPLPKAKKPGANGDDDDDGDNEPKEKKKRKRKTRERDLCDVKIKVTEFFGRDELEALGRLGISEEDEPATAANGQLTFVLEDGTTAVAPPSAGGAGGINSDGSMPFGVLEPLKRFPDGHPGAEGKRWYMVQRVNGTGKDGEPIEGADLDHKHTLEESDRIKKNSVQRWLLAQEKGKKKSIRTKAPGSSTQTDQSPSTRQTSVASPASFHVSGEARATVKSHASAASTGIILYGSGFCPFAQRIWIALELKGIPYQFIETTPSNFKDGKCMLPGLLEVCPEGITPCLRHGSWGVWESGVMMEYLEDLSMGHSLLPLGNPQLRAHCRLWVDHINRKILPFFYALLLLPMNESEDAIALQCGTYDTAQTSTATRASLATQLESAITDLVNASHASGPFFLGEEISFVDVAFAPWVIRLSRVLSYYREFPRPEVGTRWAQWVTAVEETECVRRTVSDERGYHYVYGSVGKLDHTTISTLPSPSRRFAEMNYAQKVVRTIGFGLGGDKIVRR